MPSRFRAASFAAVLFSAILLGTASAPGYALQAQTQPLQAINAVATLPVPGSQPQAAADDAQALDSDSAKPAPSYASLTEAVDAQSSSEDTDRELNCLATGVYYEAKGEPLAGQLAVAHVILNRAASGRFPASACGVLTQAGQFSFVHGGKLPSPPEGRQWRTAVAVAKVAAGDLWDNPVPHALFFHARHVRATRGVQVAQLGNQVFYR